MKDVLLNPEPGIRYQSGMVTTFTGVLILVLLTLMMFFAIRVGVFEQRVSSNEMRQTRLSGAVNPASSTRRNSSKRTRAGCIAIDWLLSDGTDGWLARATSAGCPGQGAA
jgi:Tfp pilus assembly protein PilX